ncbi:ammonium transporter [Romboutsia sp.]|uniref:ammonium transporter n=1 Tax=Romboutsia sp. TaxID=1965302 RepID=UPI003F3C33B6
MNSINYVDTTFVIFSACLVMLMTPAVALFYGGMVRKKNILSTAMHSYCSLGIVSIQWVLIGYTLAFGDNIGGFIGGFKYLFLNEVGFLPNESYSTTIPHQLFMIFQLMFAILTPAPISGAFAERMKFKAFIVFLILWCTFIYDPIAHWVWGDGGWLKTLGALDFAGGTVVHISSGISALVVAIMLGKRKDIDSAAPHHIPMTVLGGALLWFGWFGFNAGSALAVNDIAVNAFLVTNTAGSASALAWMVCEWKLNGKPTLLGFITGGIAGLVAITPAAGFVNVQASMIIGVVGGIICFYTINIVKKKIGYDDALDAFGCHGIGGIWGCIATGIFASTKINPAGADGILYGNSHLLAVQLISVISVTIFSLIITCVILKLIDLVIGIRVDEVEEVVGLDLALHGELAYSEFEVSDKSILNSRLNSESN